MLPDRPVDDVAALIARTRAFPRDRIAAWAPPVHLRLLRDTSLVVEVGDSSTSSHLRHATSMDEGGRGIFLVSRRHDPARTPPRRESAHRLPQPQHSGRGICTSASRTALCWCGAPSGELCERYQPPLGPCGL